MRLRLVIPVVVAVAALGSAASRAAAQGVEAEVVRTVQKVFEAMRVRDTAALRAVFDTGMRLINTSNRDGVPRVRVTTAAGFISLVGAAKDTLVERMHTPEVRIEDNMATLWARYDFYVNSKLSHCGVDSFQLARTQAGWKIMNIVDTQRTEGCGASSR